MENISQPEKREKTSITLKKSLKKKALQKMLDEDRDVNISDAIEEALGEWVATVPATAGAAGWLHADLQAILPALSDIFATNHPFAKLIRNRANEFSSKRGTGEPPQEEPKQWPKRKRAG